jgi:hypothetical protein
MVDNDILVCGFAEEPVAGNPTIVLIKVKPNVS